MFNPVQSCNKYAKNHATRIEEKNDGTDIPKTEENKIDLSKIEFFFNADTIPKIIPKKKEKMIEVIAKTKVTC